MSYEDTEKQEWEGEWVTGTKRKKKKHFDIWNAPMGEEY